MKTLVALRTPLLNQFVYPYERNITIVCYAQWCRLSVEDEWLESTHDRALYIDGGPMWFSKMIEWLACLETRRDNKGKMENTGWEGG
jgi:hypothetical protein